MNDLVSGMHGVHSAYVDVKNFMTNWLQAHILCMPRFASSASSRDCDDSSCVQCRICMYVCMYACVYGCCASKD
jgi:hypothetical protein